MAHDFNGKENKPLGSESLEELLRDAADDNERQLLTRAWNALEPLAVTDDPLDAELPVPKPLAELERIFRGGSGRMSEDELYSLAAAGTQGGGADAGASVDGDGNDTTFEASRRNSDRDSTWNSEAFDHEAWEDIDSGSPTRCPADESRRPSVEAPECDGDLFVLAPGGGEERIEGFNPGQDRLLFQGVRAGDLEVSSDGSGGTKLVYRGGSAVLMGVYLTEEEIRALSDFQ